MSTCNRYETDGMAYLDGEMTPEAKAEYEQHLSACQRCREEVEGIRIVMERSKILQFRDPGDEFWDRYYASLAVRLERRFGWALILVGILVNLVYALYRYVTDPEFFEIDHLAGFAIIVGILILFAAVLRQRYLESKHDKYKDVMR